MSKAKAKNQNFIQAYFANFGLRQICDFLMLGGAIVLIVGLFNMKTVLMIGLGIYVVASLLAVVRSALVLLKKDVNHRSPEFKNARINIIIMSLIFALALFGFIWGFFY